MRVFISYRRDDTGHVAGRLQDRLVSDFGATNVFLDVYSVMMGQDFRDAVRVRLAASDVVLLLVGSDWQPELLHRDNDYVRFEIEQALIGQKHIIPVLVDTAVMPDAQEVPESIRAVVYRNAVPLRRDLDFETDIARLIAGIRQLGGGQQETGRSADLDRQRGPDQPAGHGPPTQHAVVPLSSFAKLRHQRWRPALKALLWLIAASALGVLVLTSLNIQVFLIAANVLMAFALLNLVVKVLIGLMGSYDG